MLMWPLSHALFLIKPDGPFSSLILFHGPRKDKVSWCGHGQMCWELGGVSCWLMPSVLRPSSEKQAALNSQVFTQV